jgi:hypothetical protein
MIAIVFVAACPAVYAQEIPPAQAAPPAAELAPRPPARPPTPSDRRDTIRTLETVLTLAVKNGAAKLALQMRAIDPGSLFVVDTGRTRGFDLQEYGVFFDVDVPMMKQSVMWVARELSQQDTRARLENYIATQPPGDARDFAIRELRRLQAQGMRQSLSPSPSLATPVANPQGSISAASTDTTAAAVPPPPAPMAMADPNELYTEAVKTSLIGAMLDFSLGLKLGADDWLTVAARDAQGPLPGEPDDASTILIRIKGSDLAAFHSGKLTREEVLKKVEVKEI